MDPASLAALLGYMGNQGGGPNRPGSQGGGFGGFNMGSIGSAIPNILYGIFGHPERPYQRAEEEIEKNYPEAQKWQKPFYEAGAGAIPGYQEWLSGQKDPTKFINNMMGQYQESPWAKYQQQQAMRAGQNMGSATGLTGSTPLAQFMQQNARDISSQDMNQWLQNVLGINKQYGAGLNNMINMGQGAGNMLTNLASDYMTNKANLGYGEEQAREGQWGGLFGGIGQLFR